VEKELDHLDKIWCYVRDWQATYAGWKDGAFTDIRVGGRSASHACCSTVGVLPHILGLLCAGGSGGNLLLGMIHAEIHMWLLFVTCLICLPLSIPVPVLP
jgi:hypothetical protein